MAINFGTFRDRLRRLNVGFDTLRRTAVDATLPVVCVSCGVRSANRGDWCGRCYRTVDLAVRRNLGSCHRCGQNAPRPEADVIAGDTHRRFDPDVDDVLCVACRLDGPPMGFERIERIVTLWRYDESIRELITAAKVGRNSQLHAAIGYALAQRLSRRCDRSVDVVTCVPSTIRRRVVRGGSGVAEVAAVTADRLGRPFIPVLRMVRSIRKQGRLTAEERRANVRDAFAVRAGYSANASLTDRLPLPPNPWRRRSARRSVAGRRVLLIDDVVTTGATAAEVAGVLLDAGAGSVTLAAVCRAGAPRLPKRRPPPSDDGELNFELGVDGDAGSRTDDGLPGDGEVFAGYDFAPPRTRPAAEPSTTACALPPRPHDRSDPDHPADR